LNFGDDSALGFRAGHVGDVQTRQLIVKRGVCDVADYLEFES
jgi:hypothetical protein